MYRSMYVCMYVCMYHHSITGLSSTWCTVNTGLTEPVILSVMNNND